MVPEEPIAPPGLESKATRESQRATDPKAPKISVVTVSWKTRELLRECLNSIFKAPPPFKIEVFVVDNASGDGTVEMVRTAFPDVHLIANTKNVGFPSANNQALPLCKGEYVFILNPDTRVHPGAIETLVRYLETHRDVGIVAPKLVNPDGSLQRSCLGFPTLGALIMRNLFLEQLLPWNPWTRRYLMRDWDHHDEREVDQPMGAALLVRRAAIDDAGPMDDHIYMFFDEVDWCLRIKRHNWRVRYFPQAVVTHHGGASIKKSSFFRLSHMWNKSRDYFVKKHFGPLAVAALLASEMGKIAIAGAALALVYFTFRAVLSIIN